METGYSVADAMTTKPITIPSAVSVRDASLVMQQHEVGSLLVVDTQGLVGIVTTEDIVHRIAAQALVSTDVIIRDVMTKELITIQPEADIHVAVVLMKEHDIMHLPVVDANKKLVGFLTFKDVMRIEPQLFEIMAELHEMTARAKKAKNNEGYCQECGNYADELVHVKDRWLCQYCSEE